MENHKMISSVVMILGGLVLLGVLAAYLFSIHAIPSYSEFMASSTPDSQGSGSMLLLHAPKGDIKIEIATSSADQERGLSYRASLPSDQGLLFGFDKPGSYTFWMKDMNFPLDMVWIGSDKAVVGITRSISPETFPLTFLPPSPVSYVLEINAGAAASYGIATGTVLGF